MKFHRKLSKEGTIVSMCVTGWKMADPCLEVSTMFL